MKTLFTPFMKKVITLLCTLMMLALFVVSTVCADVKEAESVGSFMLGPYYQRVTKVTFDDINEKEGTLLLSINCMPDFNIELLEDMSFFCMFGRFIPGCKYVKYGKYFYRYVNKGMQADVRLKDAGNPDEIVWEGHMSDGDTISLGTDHPDGYIIEMQSYPAASIAYVKLAYPDNLSFE